MNLRDAKDKNANAGDLYQGEEDIFAYEVCDEALEAVAGNQWQCTQTISGDIGATSACDTYNNGCC